MTKHPTEYTFYTGLNTDLPALGRLLPRLDEELDGALGDVEEGRAARDERLLLHRRRRVHQEHDDRHRGIRTEWGKRIHISLNELEVSKVTHRLKVIGLGSEGLQRFNRFYLKTR